MTASRPAADAFADAAAGLDSALVMWARSCTLVRGECERGLGAQDSAVFGRSAEVDVESQGSGWRNEIGIGRRDQFDGGGDLTRHRTCHPARLAGGGQGYPGQADCGTLSHSPDFY